VLLLGQPIVAHARCRALEGVRPLIAEDRGAIDLQIRFFPQVGLQNNPGTEELIIEALQSGGNVVGAAPSRLAIATRAVAAWPVRVAKARRMAPPFTRPFLSRGVARDMALAVA
jgi:hypothetical protein